MINDKDVLDLLPEALIGQKFNPRVDQYHRRVASIDAKLVPRSPKVYKPGALSLKAGGPMWWREDNCHERRKLCVADLIEDTLNLICNACQEVQGLQNAQLFRGEKTLQGICMQAQGCC